MGPKSPWAKIILSVGRVPFGDSREDLFLCLFQLLDVTSMVLAHGPILFKPSSVASLELFLSDLCPIITSLFLILLPPSYNPL